MTPDWSAKAEPLPYAKLGDPQSLNLYVYVMDNPVTDPDAYGHCTDPTGCNTPPPAKHPKMANRQAQKQSATERTNGNIIYNETGGMRPTTKKGPGSAANVKAAGVSMGHVLKNRAAANWKGGTAHSEVNAGGMRTPQYRDSQAAAREAVSSPDTTFGARNYVLDFGRVMPKWVGRTVTVQSFGPFINKAGGGDVTKGAMVTIRILLLMKFFLIKQ